MRPTRRRVHGVSRYFRAVLAQKEVQDALAVQGIAVIHKTPEEAVPFFRAELDQHAVLVKKSGATAE